MREQTLQPDASPPSLQHGWRRWAAPLLGIAFALGVGWLVLERARRVDWPAVGTALQGYPVGTLVLALGAALATHLCYAHYDLLARRALHHGVRSLKVLAVALVSYAVTLNFGSLVGGAGFRWRLYSRLGVGAVEAGRVFALGLVTNWSGYLLLAGGLLLVHAAELPPAMTLGPEAQQLLGVAMLAVPVAYALWCSVARRRALQWRGHRFELPPADVALAQPLLGAVHWMLMGSIAWVLMPHGLAYGTVLGTLMSAAVAGLVIRVPGGLGVVEAVFIATLGDRVPEGQLVAALLAYRAAFYLLPLAGALVLHLGIEAQARRSG